MIDRIFKLLERDLGGTPYAAAVPLQGRADWRVVGAQSDMSVARDGFGRPEHRMTVELVRIG